jgi:hypothetical protein
MSQKSASLEEQLKTLTSCGLNLREDVTIEHLLEIFDSREYEKAPYRLLLTVMGGELDVEPQGFASSDIWHFDTECIEDHGDYTLIAHRMSELAKNDLPLARIKDHVDLEEEVAWLSFTLNGRTIKWDAAVDNDWVDPMILSRFAELLAQQRTDRRFTYLDLGGQDCLIGCCAPKQLIDLNKLTGLDFVWLT